MRLRNPLKRAARRVADAAVQWLWFALPVQPRLIGYSGKGLLTWLRQRRHKSLRRQVHICLLDYRPEDKKQSRFAKWQGNFTAFWINERSRVCSASLNDRIEDADVIWIYCPDPIPSNKKHNLLQTLRKARAEAPIINHPEVYNSYHEEGIFDLLAKVGVSVPRSELTNKEIGRTLAVYKTEGQHGHAPKFLSEYTGPKAGYRAFEFIDSRGPDGLYRRYRAYYLLGKVYPSLLRSSSHWNVYSQTAERTETFTMTSSEVDQIRVIAKTVGLQYFAVDYLRRKGDDSPVFVDLNVYPDVRNKLETLTRRLGYYGHWHTLDTDTHELSFDIRTGQEISETSERPFWNVFDEAVLSLLQEKSEPKR
jgi:glutathione synthase/RimK-type ligase-like ATP-grasp enzyme